jgi:hypothetical protein
MGLGQDVRSGGQWEAQYRRLRGWWPTLRAPGEGGRLRGKLAERLAASRPSQHPARKLYAYAAMKRDEDMRVLRRRAVSAGPDLAVKWDEAASWFQPSCCRYRETSSDLVEGAEAGGVRPLF